MNIGIKIAVCFWLILVLSGCSKKGLNLSNCSKYVNPFTGTGGPGNTYPGAVLPFGMVQLSPDNGLPGWDRIAGYFWPDSTIAGFSHTHLTGTGAGDMYDLLVMPFNSRFTQSLTPNGNYRPYSLFRHNQEVAYPGYYKVLLENSGIQAELTTSERVGFHRYTFVKDSASRIMLDLGYALNWDAPTETSINIENNTTISGYRKSTGWAADQHVFFVMQFSEPWKRFELDSSGMLTNSYSVTGKNARFCAIYSTKPNERILIKVALSTVSIDNARNNLDAEIPHWSFDDIKEQASQKWNNKLSAISIKGTQLQKRIFYTNLYHCYLTPSLLSDVNGTYKGADGNVHLAEGFKRYDTFSLWDTYRATHPLYTILCPDDVKDMIKSFLSHYNETGLLPVWSMAGNETNMMIGYHAVPVIVDAFFKGISMDTSKAYEACINSANENSRGINEYKKFGYIPVMATQNWSVSKTLEYAFDDWCIAQFAKALGKTEDAVAFSKRAMNWKNLYDGQTAFFRPRDSNGRFLSGFRSKEYTDEYCESNAWQYFWSVQHDINGLIDTLGKERFIGKLDSMFSFASSPTEKLPIFSTGMIGQYAHGNEPSHHVAYLYNYVNQPWKTQELVRRIITSQYADGPQGYCGNEDCGQMSAWLVLSSLGFYPVNPANGIYDLTSPWINEATIRLSEGKIFKIKAVNHSPKNVYIKEVFLNGKSLKTLQITHQQIMKGGELVYILGSQP